MTVARFLREENKSETGAAMGSKRIVSTCTEHWLLAGCSMLALCLQSLWSGHSCNGGVILRPGNYNQM